MADALNLVINPGFTVGVSFTPTLFVLDATNDAVEWVFQAREAAVITRLGYRYGARAGTPPLHTISLQGVDASGNPDGVIKGGGSPASKTFTPPADTSIDGLWQWQTLANSYTCTRGEMLAIVITSAAVGAGNSSSFTTHDTLSLVAGGDGMPYAIQNNATVRARQTARSVFGYGSATRVYGHPMQAAFLNSTLTQSSTPDELATRFLIPVGLVQSYQLQGVNCRILMGAGKTLNVVLYQGTTALATAVWDTDVGTSPTTNRVMKFRFTDANLPTLLPGVEYRIGFQPQDAAGTYNFSGVTQASNAEWEPYPLGINWYMSSRTDLGAWTDDTTTRLSCELILNQVSKASPQLIVAS